MQLQLTALGPSVGASLVMPLVPTILICSVVLIPLHDLCVLYISLFNHSVEIAVFVVFYRSGNSKRSG